VRPFAEIAQDVSALPTAFKETTRRVFLADGDALALSPRRLHEVLALLHAEQPRLTRVSSYATAQNLLDKSVQELKGLRAAGLELVYLGLESGDDETLRLVHKGMTADEQIEACRKATVAGIELSVTVILGLAGAERSLIHARATGEALSAIDPRFIGVLGLMIVPGTAVAARVADGDLVVPDAEGMLRELREIIAATDVSDCVFRCNHASNYLPLGGRLPKEKRELLAALDEVIAEPDRAALRPESRRLL
jgi:radical SAM superfamily enzyme YgiQ (UPF0313 family)